MRKSILIVSSLLVLTIAGFFSYEWLAPREKSDPFQIVPENASLIIESSRIYKVWEDLKSQKLWQNVKAVPSVAALSGRLALLDSLLGQGNKSEFFEGKKLVASLHKTGNSSDYIFYIPVNSSSDEDFLRDVLKNIQQQEIYTLEERTFNGYTIASLTSKEPGLSFSYVTYKNLFVGSFSTVLLEDLVRSIDKKKSMLFWKKEESSHKPAEGTTTVYVNYKELPGLLSLLADSEIFKTAASFAEESVLEFNVNDKELLLNGFTYSSQKNSFINNFRMQQPKPFNLKYYVPNNAAALYYYGFDNGKTLRKSLEEFWKKNDPGYLKEVQEKNKKYKIDIGSLYEDFGNEIGLCLTQKDTSLVNKLVYIHAHDSERLFLQLSKMVTVMAASNPQELDNEIWKGIKISQMNMEEFPSALLGTIYDGFPQSYFAAIDDYIVFAASKQDIKDLVNDVETENVWGKTLSINSSLEETITEFNVGLFVNVQHTWQSLLNYAVPEVKAELQKNKELLQGFDFLALQFSHLNQTVLTNIVLTHNLSDPLIVSEETVEKQELVLEHSVLNHFYLADSKSPGKDLLFQDSLLSLQMVGSDLQQRWTFPLTDTIAGELYTIDVDKDRKWDYVFAAGNKIYALDGKGKLLQNFPFVLKDTVRIKNLSVVDYSNSKEYRIVASDKNGHVYFYDLKGENLEGWRPRKFSGAIADKVKHIRVGDKDMIIAVQENGVVNITNRRGEVYAGFPLDLKSDGIKSMVIQKGKDFEKTLIVVQDRNRRMITFNLTGAIVKEDDRKHVQLCPDSKGNSYAIVKSEEKSILIMNLNSGKTIRIPFYLGNSSIKYWNFSTRGEFFTIKEHPTGKLYIFDQQGKALKNSPLHSEGYSDIFFNEKKNRLEFYNIHKGKLQVIEL